MPIAATRDIDDPTPSRNRRTLERIIKSLAPFIYKRKPNINPKNATMEEPKHRHNLLPIFGIYFPKMGLNMKTEIP